MVDDDTERHGREWAHDIRKKIDACINEVFTFKTDSRYTKAIRQSSLAFTKLEEAKMWMGKCLEALGSKLPAQYQDKAK